MKWSLAIYRRCACTETAHDAHFNTARKVWTWRCRNCGSSARNRLGDVREVYEHEHARPGSSERAE